MVFTARNQGRRNYESYVGYTNAAQRLNRKNWGVLFLHLTFNPAPHNTDLL